MNLAVKFYVDETDNISNVPGVWPSQVVELDDSTTLPSEGGPWILMTEAELLQYKSDNQATYDTWSVNAGTSSQARTTAFNQIQNHMAWGQQVIIAFRVYTLAIPDDDALTMLSAFQTILQLVQLGILQQSAAILGSMTDVPLLDQLYDPANPTGPTVREYFIAFILQGDPL